MEKRKGPGQPTKITENTLRILEDAFTNGATDREACFLAEISEETLYSYQRRTPEYIKRKAALRDMAKFRAKKNVVGAITQGDLSQSNWWLERKAKDEGFNTRTEITGKDGDKLIPDKEAKEKTEELLDKII